MHGKGLILVNRIRPFKSGSQSRTPFALLRASSLDLFGGCGDQLQFLLSAPSLQFFFPLRRVRPGHWAFLIQRRQSHVLTHAVCEICRDPGIQSAITVNDVHPPGPQCESSLQVLVRTRARRSAKLATVPLYLPNDANKEVYGVFLETAF
jgi:hypothetical protein